MQSVSSIVKQQGKAAGSAFSKEGTPFFKPIVQPQLTINQPNDIYEQVADAVADKVMRMQLNESNDVFIRPMTIPSVQRKCTEYPQVEIERKEENEENVSNSYGLNNYIASLNAKGESLPEGTRSFFEPRFDYDFSNVKVHTDSVAANSAQSIHALAYTAGNNIVFNNSQYAPNTDSGKKLLAHELTHVIQQQENKNIPSIQRTVRNGRDHAGSYAFDDRACALEYDQNWFFTFPASMTDTQRNAYMARAENQVELTWSHRHRLVPTTAGCACQTNGVDVNVDLHTLAEARRGRHGYNVEVRDDDPRAFTNPVTSNLTLADNDDVPQNFGASQAMPVLAHEFGHTLGITDEYSGWNHFWNFFALGVGAADRDSLMNLGSEVRPRHYQHFADLISNEIEGCQYRPARYTSRELANPVVQTGVGAAIALDNADFILDLHVDRRLGNSDLLGLFTPRIGYRALLNASNGNMMSGPTASLNLNRLAHPVYLDIGTGLLYDPEDPGRPATLNIPLSVTAGIRRDGFSAGINYTGLVDVLNNRGYTHMVGLTFTFDR